MDTQHERGLADHTATLTKAEGAMGHAVIDLGDVRSAVRTMAGALTEMRIDGLYPHMRAELLECLAEVERTLDCARTALTNARSAITELPE